MKDKVLDAIKKFDMIKENDTVIVGVSGGADSMSLLYMLLDLRKSLNFSIVAAHINHCLRGEESKRDELFVRNFCERSEVKLHVLKINVAQKAKELNLGIEECGRTVRYEFFSSLVKNDHFKIATAHTLSDSIETFFFNLTRGSGLKGLCGIPPRRSNIVRPLIFVSRSEVEDYCKKNGISFITDTSNLSRDYTRNKIRLDAIPVFKEINSSFETSFSKLLKTLTEDNDYIESVVNNYFDNDISCIKTLHTAIKTRVVIKIVKQKCNVTLEKKHVDLILSMIEHNKEGSVNIPGNFFVFINEGGHLDVLSHDEIRKREKNFFLDHWQAPFSLGNIKIKDNINVNAELISLSENYNYEKIIKILKIKKLQFNNALDYDKIKKSAVLRNRCPGDFFVPRGRKIKKKLKNLFNELKFPLDKRYETVLLADKNEVLWIDGVGASEKCKVTKNTKNLLLISSEGR